MASISAASVGLVPLAGFQASLVRKLFTYNGINAVVSYIGHLKGHRLLSEAAPGARDGRRPAGVACGTSPHASAHRSSRDARNAFPALAFSRGITGQNLVVDGGNVMQ
jgi:hypothetical protein